MTENRKNSVVYWEVTADFSTYRNISECKHFEEAIDIRHDKIKEGATEAHIKRCVKEER